MRIIIVGAGVSGLSTYLLLEKLLPPILGKTTRKLEFLIYDSHISIPAGAGSGAGPIGNTSILPPTSIKILQQIDPELYTLFKSQGFENHAFTIRSARGYTLAKLPTTTTTTATTATVDQKEEYAISCPHAVLKECLREIVGRREQPILHGKVIDVELGGGKSPDGNQKPRVKFSDGRPSVEADLVIGADGVHSVVKRAVFGQEADEKHYAPEFEGFGGVGSFIKMDNSKEKKKDEESVPDIIAKQKSAVVTFGPTGSFGYAAVSPLSACTTLGWWSNWPSEEIPSPESTDAAQVQKQLEQRHGTWKDPIIQKCISASNTSSVYPLWTTPKLPHWGKGGCVLLGDAAHTLQATSGQGAAQALEDSVTFSLLLTHYLSESLQEEETSLDDFDDDDDQRSTSSHALAQSIDSATKALYELRHERVANIKTQTRNLYFGRRKITTLWWEYTYYCFLFLVTNFPRIGK
ncbi:FAD/NAD(P)-binding domain-containing protein [Sphaerulina musiva SO2202]|uniref:FAD/NAD(P)-binding domain-containing protein n=1 Tax=Sphaerulina musiva (strain SO2202) TaxID=692275 RepID=N1QDH1_SPHMS|nr:FAD/NAD(P)-binding domain-containing protein [Sphaerulina musiva SO2202]EMF09450.1 FAD/NAD(P)-binding domain-containing protein [Sphaerulina musiva SO2202]